MAILIKTDGSEKEVYPKGKKNGFTLKEVYDLIECSMVEIACRFSDGKMMLVDEEGWFSQKPVVNTKATLLMGHNIVGNALIVTEEEFQ